MFFVCLFCFAAGLSSKLSQSYSLTHSDCPVEIAVSCHTGMLDRKADLQGGTTSLTTLTDCGCCPRALNSLHQCVPTIRVRAQSRTHSLAYTEVHKAFDGWNRFRSICKLQRELSAQISIAHSKGIIHRRNRHPCSTGQTSRQPQVGWETFLPGLMQNPPKWRGISQWQPEPHYEINWLSDKWEEKLLTALVILQWGPMQSNRCLTSP